MHRVSLALALMGAVIAAGCTSGANGSGSGSGRGVSEGTFTVVIQNGQSIGGATANPKLAITGGYITSNPLGIDCGEGATHQACSFTFSSAPPVTLTANAVAPNILLGWAGDCSGVNLTCTLTGKAEKYIVVQFGTAADRTTHPNWTDALAHGHEVVAETLTCTDCHGESLQGAGLAPSCFGCHKDSAALFAGIETFKAIPAANQGKVEACELCHASGAYSSATSHALSEQLAVKATVIGPAVVSGSDVVISYNIKVAGQNRDDFLRSASAARKHNEDAAWVYSTAQQAGVRTKLPAKPDGTYGNFTIVSNGAGNYTLTLPGFGTSAVAGTKYMVSVMNGTTGFGSTATIVAELPGGTHDVVGDQACINCHGPVTRGELVHDVTVPQGVGPCIVCHNRTGSADPRLPGAGSGLMGIVHGIHNSEAMPDGVYTFTWTNGNKFNFSIGFPGNMDNCATCHDSQTRLDAVRNAPVSYGLCISCHDSFAAFPNAPASHLAFTTTQACDGCHAGETVSTHHNGLVTERAGLIWDGADQSMVLAPTIKLDITGVSVTATNVVVTWTAKDQNGVAYDPCNNDYASGPVFFNIPYSGLLTEGCTNTAQGCGNTISLLRAYAQGDDWVNDNYPTGTSPGQPKSTTLTTSNTTCAAGIATSTLALQTTAATRGIIALQGKPQVRFTNGNVIWVRSQTPTREFLVADGTSPATQRRQVVAIEKCLACHPGTLYQHGGSRVDKIELCLMCHNPSSSEQNNRVGMGVTAAEAYDGKPGETYDLRTLVHAVHSAGESGVPLMYYRSNGIFFFGSKDALARVPNWPAGSECISCVDVEDGPLTYCKVFGSSAGGDKPVANPDGTCGTPVASTDGTWRPHRVTLVDYPRALNDCGACHVDGFDTFPSQTQAMAVTVDTGDAPYNNLTNDALIGPTTAACMTCHQSSVPERQNLLRTHAYDFSWAPQVFPGGRADLMIPFP